MSTGGIPSASNRIPIVRHFVPCQKIDVLSGNRFTLHNVIHQFRPIPSGTFPHRVSELWLFVQLTDAIGFYHFRVELAYLEDPQLNMIWPPVTMNLGSNPLEVHNWPVQLKEIVFPGPGAYEFRLYYGRNLLASAPIFARPN